MVGRRAIRGAKWQYVDGVGIVTQALQGMLLCQTARLHAVKVLFAATVPPRRETGCQRPEQWAVPALKFCNPG